jgi:hypothetical protein
MAKKSARSTKKSLRPAKKSRPEIGARIWDDNSAIGCGPDINFLQREELLQCILRDASTASTWDITLDIIAHVYRTLAERTSVRRLVLTFPSRVDPS